MKTLYTAVIITALTWASVTKTLAQDEPQAPPAPPAPPAPVAIIHDAQQLTEDAVHKAQKDLEKQLYHYQQELGDLPGRLRMLTRRVGGGGKSLVVRSSDMVPQDQRNLEEDLAVMTHILDKSLAEKLPDDQSVPVAMGISVAFVPGEGPTRSLYLDGYGAFFFAKVNFPLLAPPADKNVEKEKAPVDSSWEEARQEVYGQPTAKTSNPRFTPEYDAAKVNALQQALLNTLKDASNIRNVKPDESITVCVIGAPAEGSKRAVAVSSSSDGGFAGGNTFGSGNSPFVWYTTAGQDGPAENKTTLTIRVKKADCEAFTKGKLTADEFRGRAMIRIYGDSTIAP
jgi:hypothetical protein